MTETITTILQWLIPSGSLATVVVWLASKTLRNLRETKEIHDTYKTMYEDVQVTLISISDEYNKLCTVVVRLEKAISRAQGCRYADNCPVNHELRGYKETIPRGSDNDRQRYNKRNENGPVRPRSSLDGDAIDPDGEPP